MLLGARFEGGKRWRRIHVGGSNFRHRKEATKAKRCNLLRERESFSSGRGGAYVMDCDMTEKERRGMKGGGADPEKF